MFVSAVENYTNAGKNPVTMLIEGAKRACNQQLADKILSVAGDPGRYKPAGGDHVYPVESRRQVADSTTVNSSSGGRVGSLTDRQFSEIARHCTDWEVKSCFF